MLMRLLSLVEEDDVHSYTTLSGQLSVSKNLLEQMLQDLARMGYIVPVGGACDISQCYHCPLGGDCVTDSRGNVWVITKKGMQTTEDKQSGTGPSTN